ncbi:lysozyme inhibitor [Pseudomonas helleri]|uniref:Lysozyme inhibitor n=1 Tax=Pseudomonas helleri TaxID=1608996 RepID=A0A6L5HNR8_9PSED|nr:lysozyme inhibitor [Pseudomonas helleri]
MLSVSKRSKSVKTAITLAYVGASLLSGVANAQTPQYLFDVTGKSPYKQAYQDMLAFPEWVRTGQGTSTPLQEVVIDGQKYTLGQMCKPHDCADNQLIVIFSPDKKKAWGLLATRSTDGQSFNTQLLGAPEAAIKEYLNKTLAENNPED